MTATLAMEFRDFEANAPAAAGDHHIAVFKQLRVKHSFLRDAPSTASIVC